MRRVSRAEDQVPEPDCLAAHVKVRFCVFHKELALLRYGDVARYLGIDDNYRRDHFEDVNI